MVIALTSDEHDGGSWEGGEGVTQVSVQQFILSFWNLSPGIHIWTPSIGYAIIGWELNSCS